jgi:hypothetical protein
LRCQLKALLQEALLRDTVAPDIPTRPAADARAYFEGLQPLESFAAADADDTARALRNKSHILKNEDDA